MSGSSAEKGSSHEQDLGVRGQRPGEPDPLLHPAGQLAREAVLVAVEVDEAQAALGDLPALRLRLALHLQRKRDVVAHRAVRKQRHVLEHHADVGGAQLPQLPLAQRQHVPAQDLDATGGRFDQPVDVAHHGGLARARQPHDAEDLAARDLERAIRDADHASEPLQHLRLGEAVAGDRPHRFVDPRAEDLPHAVQLDDRFTQSGWLLAGGMSASSQDALFPGRMDSHLWIPAPASARTCLRGNDGAESAGTTRVGGTPVSSQDAQSPGEATPSSPDASRSA